MRHVTNHQAKFFAHALTRAGGEGIERLGQSLLNAAVDLNPHQIEAALFALHSPLSKGVLLADEVGLGKTIEAGLVLCQLWAERKRRLVVICPASLRKQWQGELEDKFNLPAQIVDARSARESAKGGRANPYDAACVLIASYPYAARTAEHLKKIAWDAVVMDEAHKLRNSWRESNKIGQALRRAFADRRKLLLTATPLQNSLTELYGIATLLDENAFGDLPTFRSRFVNGDGDPDELRLRLKEFCWRTLRKDVLPYIRYTNRIPMTETFSASDRENRLYEDVSAYLRDESTYAFPVRQRTMLTMVVRKVLASSTWALVGTLESILARLEQLRSAPERRDEDLLERILADDADLVETLEEDEDDAGADAEESGPSDSRPKPDADRLEREIATVRDFIRRARGIGADTKTRHLLVALEAGWKKLDELGAASKAVVFTESRRSMDFLRDYLEANGYAGQVLCFSGGGRKDAAAEAIYREYREAHPEARDSRPVMLRHALIDAFKNRAKILIATEAGAEGINLQFCSLVVNYDLPWNPQRVEQRIGRCHRYGQKHDVIVVNFCNARNAADRRVFELLRDKFNLFAGLFGASNDVLGAVNQDGLSFARRIHDILQQCRTQEAIEAAFDQLQNELQDQIAAQREATCRAVMENLEDEVRERLKIDPQYAANYLSEGEARFMALTRNALAERAVFADDAPAFTLTRPPCDGIAAGRYALARGELPAGVLPYRPGSALGEWAIARAGEADTPYAALAFNVSAYKGRMAVVERLRGKGGYLSVDLLRLNSLDAQEYLLFSAMTEDGKFLDPDIAEKMFRLDAQAEVGIPAMPEALAKRLADNAAQYAKSTANRVGEANNEHFKAATERLIRWSEDQIAAATRKVRALHERQLEVERQIRQARTLDEQAALQTEFDRVRRDIRRARAEVTAIEDETDERRHALLNRLQRKLIPEISRETLFTIRWRVV